MIYLRPCPYCLAETKSYVIDHESGYNRALQVRCYECGAVTRIEEPDDWDNVREGKHFDAVERWNTRASDKR